MRGFFAENISLHQTLILLSNLDPDLDHRDSTSITPPPSRASYSATRHTYLEALTVNPAHSKLVMSGKIALLIQ